MPSTPPPTEDIQPTKKRRKVKKKKVRFAQMLQVAMTSAEEATTSIQLPPAVIAKKVDHI